MSIGESILALMGREDPRQRLIQAVSGGTDQTGAQYAGGAAPAAGTSAPAGGAPDTQVAAAFKSPPDLAAMYQDLTKYQSRAQNIDRGFGLIGSAISQDGNRQATLNAFTGDSPAAVSPQGIAELAMTINKSRAAQASRAAQLAALPAIAERYGLDMATARQLFESGKLEDVIANAEKPNMSTQKGANGQLLTVDQNTGVQVGGPVGPIESPLSVTSGPNGSQFLFDKNAGAIVRQLVPENADTNDSRNYKIAFDDHVARGLPADQFLPYDEWLQRDKKSGASQTNVDLKAETAEQSKIGGDRADDYINIRKSARSAMDTLQNYDLIQKGLDSGVRTGALGEGEQQARKLYAYMFPEDADNAQKVAGGELIQKVGNKMALLMRNPESGMGMPGSLSDKDLAFLKESQLGLTTTGAGNKLTLEVFRRMEQRKIDQSVEADKWVDEHGTMAGFNKHWREYSKSRPMFDDINVADYIDDSPEAKETRRKAVLEKYKLGAPK